MVQSSKRMVSRKRKVVDVKKPVFRDPRFDNMGGAAPDENTLGHRYAFLNDYRASEIAELRSTIKKTKNEAEKEKLKKKLLSMESQQKAREAKEQQQQIVRDHKKKEKELVTQGKQPFFLKKCMSFSHVLANITGHWMLTISSRAKETCPDRPLPEHEIEAARSCHRTASQEGHCQGAQEHARKANGVSILPSIGLQLRRAGIALACPDTHPFQHRTVHHSQQEFIPAAATPRDVDLRSSVQPAGIDACQMQSSQPVSAFPTPSCQVLSNCNDSITQNRIVAAESHAHWPS
jgi:hypothetical protein